MENKLHTNAKHYILDSSQIIEVDGNGFVIKYFLFICVEVWDAKSPRFLLHSHTLKNATGLWIRRQGTCHLAPSAITNANQSFTMQGAAKRDTAVKPSNGMEQISNVVVIVTLRFYIV